jgi:hypothetical protein
MEKESVISTRFVQAINFLGNKEMKNCKRYELHGVHLLSLVNLYINLCIVFATTDTHVHVMNIWKEESEKMMLLVQFSVVVLVHSKA